MSFIENNIGIRTAFPIANLNENRKAETQAAAPALQKPEGPDYVKAKAEYTTKRDKLEKTTQDFEAVFVGMMLKQMRKSMAGQNALFGNSPESKMYQDMMDDSTAKHMSKVGTFGLAKVLFKTMSSTLPPDPDKEQTPTPNKELTPAPDKNTDKKIGSGRIDSAALGTLFPEF